MCIDVSSLVHQSRASLIEVHSSIIFHAVERTLQYGETAAMVQLCQVRLAELGR
jgi:hypothetical protein